MAKIVREFPVEQVSAAIGAAIATILMVGICLLNHWINKFPSLWAIGILLLIGAGSICLAWAALTLNIFGKLHTVVRAEANVEEVGDAAGTQTSDNAGLPRPAGMPDQAAILRDAKARRQAADAKRLAAEAAAEAKRAAAAKQSPVSPKSGTEDAKADAPDVPPEAGPLSRILDEAKKQAEDTPTTH